MVLAQVMITSLLLGYVLIVIIFLVSFKSFLDLEKSSPFECGFSPKQNSRVFFSLQFFLVTLIFLIFDVELILMFPFLGVTKFSPDFYSGFTLLLFIALLSLGLFWEWSQSMLEWNKY